MVNPRKVHCRSFVSLYVKCQKFLVKLKDVAQVRAILPPRELNGRGTKKWQRAERKRTSKYEPNRPVWVNRSNHMFACESLCNRMGFAQNRKQSPLSRIYTKEQIDRSSRRATFIRSVIGTADKGRPSTCQYTRICKCPLWSLI